MEQSGSSDNPDQNQASEEHSDCRIEKFIDQLKPTKTCDQLKNYFYSENQYNLPVFVKSFTELLKSFSSWTNLMGAYFHDDVKVATSARSEAYFSSLKKERRKISEKPLRIDKFLVWHCQVINDGIKLAHAHHQLEKLASKTSRKPRVSEGRMPPLVPVENWRNKVRMKDNGIDFDDGDVDEVLDSVNQNNDKTGRETELSDWVCVNNETNKNGVGVR